MHKVPGKHQKTRTGLCGDTASSLQFLPILQPSVNDKKWAGPNVNVIKQNNDIILALRANERDFSNSQGPEHRDKHHGKNFPVTR